MNKDAYIQDFVKVIKKLLTTTATQDKNGMMSAEDKVRLDTIVTNNIKIVKCTYEEYKALVMTGKVEDDTFYAITNIVDEDEARDVLGG